MVKGPGVEATGVGLPLNEPRKLRDRTLRPNLETVGCAHELGGNAQPFTRLSYAPLHDGANIQCSSYVAYVWRFPGELKRGGPGGNMRPGRTRQGVDDFLRNSLAEIFLIMTRAEVQERQNCDRGLDGVAFVVWLGVVRRPHFGNETVSTFRNGLYVGSVIAYLPQRLPQQEHRLREIALFDKSIGPYAVQKGLALDQPPVLFHKSTEQVEHFWHQRDRIACGQENLFGRVEQEGAELVQMPIDRHAANKSSKKKGMVQEGLTWPTNRTLDSMSTASEYLLAGCANVVERLRIQALTWELEVERMLNEIGVERGWTCIDIGCGSTGIIGPLARRVGPFGKVYALDRDAVLLDAAREYLDREGFGNVVFQQSDLFSNSLPLQSFDLVHARFMLAPIGREREVLEQLTSLVRRGGVVALEEPDARTWRCDPATAEWERIKTSILNAFEQGGGDFNVGGRRGNVLRRSGVDPVSVRETTLTSSGGHPYSC